MRAARARTEDLERELLESNAELAETAEQLATLRVQGGDPDEVREAEVSEVVTNLQEQLEESRDTVERKQWTIDQLQKDIELEVMRAKEKLRDELHTEYARELSTRDDLVQLLKGRVAELEEQMELGGSQRQFCSTLRQTPPKTSVAGKDLGGGSTHPSDPPDIPPLGSEENEPTLSRRKLTVPSLPKFSGDKLDDDSFDRWIRKLQRHAELERWTEREKLLQLELHLVGRAEQVYEVLPDENKTTFTEVVDLLKQRLQPA